MIDSVLQYLYDNWSYICVPIAVYVTIVVLSSYSVLDPVLCMIWLQFPVYLIHQFEEHAYPGNFKEYANRRIFKEYARSMPFTNKNIFWINILLIWVLFPLCAVLAQNYKPQIGSILPYMSLFNAALHSITALRTREYNPGLITSVLLNVPCGLYTLYLMHQKHLLTFKVTIAAFSVALLIHLMLVIYSMHSYKREIKDSTA